MRMENPRKYGTPPYSIAVIHGGPGAGGEMAPVARKLASYGWGSLEPLQRATTLDGQVEELGIALERHAHVPATLIGFSWGAWLSYIVAARHPRLVEKLILVGSGPFQESYVAHLGETRMSRLRAEERTEFEALLRLLHDPGAANPLEDKDASLSRLGALASKASTFDRIPHDADESRPAGRVGRSGEIYQGVWNAAAEMRRSGELLALAGQIACPVVAIHGDYDPHPAEGVREPLSAMLRDFRFVLLEQCGHMPWIERQARDRFYQVLREALPPSTDRLRGQIGTE